MSDSKTPDQVMIGDWVRFTVLGELVIGQVEYIKEPPSWERSPTLVTTEGEVKLEEVLEIRSIDNVVWTKGQARVG